MTESKQESCITKTKKNWKEIYSSPCFWLKLLTATIILGLAIFGLFTIVTSALYYFGEPLSYFDPERLGQLGDFLGGTLNPIFGFATVCLLLWSVFIQRKELSLTREELGRSATALNNQFQLSLNEYNRKQLEELHSLLIKRYESLFSEKFPEQKVVINRHIKPDSDTPYSSYKNLEAFLLRDLRDGDQIRYLYQDTPSEKQQQIKTQIKDLHIKIQFISLEICEITENESIKSHYNEENSHRDSTLRLLHIISND